MASRQILVDDVMNLLMMVIIRCNQICIMTSRDLHDKQGASSASSLVSDYYEYEYCTRTVRARGSGNSQYLIGRQG